MSYLIIPSRRRTQPPFGTRPNWDHPLFGGQSPLILYTGWENKDWVQPLLSAVPTGTVTFNNATPIGVGIQPAAGGANFVSTNQAANVSGYPFTFFGAWVTITAASAAGLGSSNASGTNFANLTFDQTSALVECIVGDNTGSTTTNRRTFQFAFSPANNVPVYCAMTIRTNTTGTCFINGVSRTLTAAGTGGAPSSAVTTAARIGYRTVGAVSGAKQILLMGWRNGDCADTELQRFSAFPWEIFNTPRKFIFGVSAATTHIYTPTGGLAFAGSATLAKTKSALSAGGMTLAGTATVAKTKVYTPSGGLTFAGAATATKTKAYTPSGGVVFAGSATLAKSKAYTPTGGVTFAGTATLAKSKSYVPSGGIALAGVAAVLKIKTFLPTGGIVFAGVADLAKVKSYAPSGGLIFGGAASTIAVLAAAAAISPEPVIWRRRTRRA